MTADPLLLLSPLQCDSVSAVNQPRLCSTLHAPGWRLLMEADCSCCQKAAVIWLALKKFKILPGVRCSLLHKLFTSNLFPPVTNWSSADWSATSSQSAAESCIQKWQRRETAGSLWQCCLCSNMDWKQPSAVLWNVEVLNCVDGYQWLPKMKYETQTLAFYAQNKWDAACWKSCRVLISKHFYTLVCQDC